MKNFGFLLLLTFTTFLKAENNQSLKLYTNGWFYLPGIDRNIKECLVIELKDGEVLIELFEDDALQHVSRIKELANEGAYDGVVFHRVIDGFMAQTGDVQYGNQQSLNMTNVGSGSSSLPNLASEFNSRMHTRGVCSMARASDPHSANSQFFICLANSTFLDNQYTIWGQVISGMEYVDNIKKGDPLENGKVTEPDAMKKVYLREMTHDKISGWLYSDSSVHPYFYDATKQAWTYFDQQSSTPRFYNFTENKWYGLN